MRVTGVATLILAVTALTDAAWAADSAQLVGVWEVVKGPPGTPAGSTLTFKRGGQFESKIKGTENTFTGKFRVEGDSLMLDPPGFPATLQVINANTIVIVGITGPAEYRRQGAGNRAAKPRAGPKSARSGAQPKAKQGATKWAVVTGGGKFSVEMPSEPNAEESGTSTGPGGEFEYARLACERFDAKVNYVVVTLEANGEIPEANVDKAIEQVRDDSADHLGSGRKLISDKPIRLGEVAGREFTIKISKPSVNILGRAFVRGNMVFLVMAASKAKDARMPPEVDRFLDSFSLGESPSKGKGGAASLMAWGPEVDPDGDVEVERRENSLTMTIPAATAHVLAPERGKMNAPRVMRPVEGPFVASVLVDGVFRPARGSTLKGLSSRQAGGLILWKDAGNYLVFQHRATANDDDGRDGAVLEEVVGGRKGVTLRQPVASGALFLRLEHKKDQIVAAYSDDGKSWKELKPVDVGWASGEVQVGVVGVNTSTGPHKVHFDNLTIEQP